MKENSGFTPLERKISNRGNKRFLTGFTLIEIIISGTIISLVAIGVYSVFASGIDVWQRGRANRSYERNIRLVCEKLTRDLRNTFRFSNITLEGEEDSITFAALIENSQDGEIPQYEVGRISYFLNDNDVFCRKKETYPELSQDGTMGLVNELIPNISELNFRYCYLDNATGNYKWKDSWTRNRQDSIPKAVRIELVFKDKSVQESRFSKTILIPIGTGEQEIELAE